MSSKREMQEKMRIGNLNVNPLITFRAVLRVRRDLQLLSSDEEREQSGSY
jgi:hypothetical protein